MSEGEKKPGVGIGVIVIKDGKLLLGKRKTHGKDTWSVPGGWLDFNESWEDCAVRECLEETGVKISKPVFATATNNIMPQDGLHTITLFMKAEYVGGKPQTIEQEKFVDVGWYAVNRLPSPLFTPLHILIMKNPELLNNIAEI